MMLDHYQQTKNLLVSYSAEGDGLLLMPDARGAPSARPSCHESPSPTAAAAMMRKLYTAHGPLMFHQSGGCCDGSSPMCYPEGEFRTGASDVLLQAEVEGIAEPVTFWMGGEQFQRWRHTHLTVDVVPGRGGGFSLEAPEGVRFLIRSRLLTDAEDAALNAH